jgi:hypothetical protein
MVRFLSGKVITLSFTNGNLGVITCNRVLFISGAFPDNFNESKAKKPEGFVCIGGFPRRLLNDLFFPADVPGPVGSRDGDLVAAQAFVDRSGRVDPRQPVRT